ncbi:hypothetical protein [Ensifer sp. 22564]|uniref:hypothetical protein n=1 Tax=Ensifer sp. 22564 TaxID=3453943 RepID=UPI003F82D6B3
MVRTLGPKEREVMDYLHERVFDPILTSASASDRLKQGIRYTIMRMQERDAAGMVHYYWAAVKGTDPSINFAALMRSEGFNRFEEVLEDFRERFNDRFLLRRR